LGCTVIGYPSGGGSSKIFDFEFDSDDDSKSLAGGMVFFVEIMYLVGADNNNNSWMYV
jgi:hypothetical protein